MSLNGKMASHLFFAMPFFCIVLNGKMYKVHRAFAYLQSLQPSHLDSSPRKRFSMR